MTIAFASDYVPARVKQQLELFAIRCINYSDDVAAGKLDFLDAADLCQDAAVASGLAASVGMDVVQAVMCTAFANARRWP
jgi:hypothetical protein